MDNMLGSVERDNVDSRPWNVVVCKAKSKQDMRECKGNARRGTHSTVCGDVCNLEREPREGNMCSVEQLRGSCERVPVIVDSGAIV